MIRAIRIGLDGPRQSTFRARNLRAVLGRDGTDVLSDLISLFDEAWPAFVEPRVDRVRRYANEAGELQTRRRVS